MLCCSPHLFSVVTLPQESKVAIQLCMYMSISSINSSHNVNDKNVQAEQNHSNSQCLRKCHNLCWKCLPSADTQQRRLKQRLVEAWSAMPQRVIDEATDEWCRHVDTFAVVYLPKADTSNTSYDTYVGLHSEFEWFCSACTWLLLTEQIHTYMHN